MKRDYKKREKDTPDIVINNRKRMIIKNIFRINEHLGLNFENRNYEYTAYLFSRTIEELEDFAVLSLKSISCE